MHRIVFTFRVLCTSNCPMIPILKYNAFCIFYDRATIKQRQYQGLKVLLGLQCHRRTDLILSRTFKCCLNSFPKVGSSNAFLAVVAFAAVFLCNSACPVCGEKLFTTQFDQFFLFLCYSPPLTHLNRSVIASRHISTMVNLVYYYTKFLNAFSLSEVSLWNETKQQSEQIK